MSGWYLRTLTGTVIAERYVVGELLGEGGTSRIYSAEDNRLGRAVAIKVLAPSCRGRSEHVHRLFREAYIGAAMGHVNVCTVSDIGELPNGDPFFVMERLVGQTLDRAIAAARFLPHDAVDVVMQILSALGAAHDRGIVHRDIKPMNIFLAEARGLSARVKLLDFGIAQTPPGVLGNEARRYEDDRKLTATGTVIGTPQYMAPEQANGQRDLDARVDIYACGVLLYEMLSGRRPFQASSYVALLNKILHDRPKPLARLAPQVPPALVEIVERAMASDRRRRYRSTFEMQRALRGLEAAPVNDAGDSGEWNYSTIKTRAEVGGEPVTRPARPHETVRRMQVAAGSSTLPTPSRRLR